MVERWKPRPCGPRRALQSGALMFVLFYVDIFAIGVRCGKTCNKCMSSSGSNQKAISDLCFCIAPIEDPSLAFALENILKEGNYPHLEEYTSLVVDATVRMTTQMEAFRDVFNQGEELNLSHVIHL